MDKKESELLKEILEIKEQKKEKLKEESIQKFAKKN